MTSLPRPWRREAIAIGGLVVAILLPLWFNPWHQPPFEPAKVLLFQGVVVLMAIAALTERLMVVTHRPSDRMAGIRLLPRRSEVGRATALWALLFAGAHLVATALSPEPWLSLWGPAHNPHGAFTTVCGVAFFILLTDALRHGGRLDRLVTATLLGSVPVAVYGLVQYFGQDPLPWITDAVSPVLSTMGRSNFLGAYLAMVVPFTLLRLADRSGAGNRLRYGVVLALQVTCVWLTLARAAWLALIAGCLCFLGLMAWRRRSRSLALLAVVVLLVGFGWYSVMDTVSLPRPERYLGIAEPNPAAVPFADLRAASVHARLIIWQTTLALIGRRWLTGYGPERFATVFADHYPVELARYQGPQVVVDDPHNLFLDQLMAAGAPALVAFLGVVGSFGRLAVATFRRAREREAQAALAAVLAAVAAFLVQAQFNPDVVVLWAFFWLALAWGVALCHRLTVELGNNVRGVVAVA